MTSSGAAEPVRVDRTGALLRRCPEKMIHGVDCTCQGNARGQTGNLNDGRRRVIHLSLCDIFSDQPVLCESEARPQPTAGEGI
eukprot:scaffold230707_cov19-Prasinocladus_malaysianus.AAC.2